MGWQPMEPDYALCGMNNWVGSFDPIKFIYFMLATVLIPYPIYVFVATVFNWEHRAKRPARHYQDLLNATSYGVIVFIFGNYAQTLNWITILAFWITWPSYSLIAEQDFAKTSLPSWKTWPFGMYALFAGATAVVLVFAGYHIYLAIVLTRSIPGFIGYYLLGLLIPVFLTLIGYACLKQQNMDLFHLSRLYNWMLQLQWKRESFVAASKARKQKKTDDAKLKTIDPPSSAENGSAGVVHDTGAGTVVVHVNDSDGGNPSSFGRPGSSSPHESEPSSSRNGSRLVSRVGSLDPLVDSRNQFNNTSSALTETPAAATAVTSTVPAEQEVSIQPYQPYVWSAAIPGYFHPHHWQLFYTLAFFTRFDHWVSRIGAGITLGCYMQGIMAYGFDYLIEE